MTGFLLEVKKAFLPSTSKRDDNPPLKLLTKDHTPPPSEEVISPAIHGTVCVEQDRVLVKDPMDGGDYPVIWVPKDTHIEVLVDGTPITGKAVVSESTTIEIRFHNDKPEVSVEHFVSKDKLQVSVRITRKQGHEYHLESFPEGRKALLRLTSIPIEPPKVPPQEIVHLLVDSKYKGDLDEDAFNRLVSSNMTEEIVILRGIEPINGRMVSYQPSHLQKDYDPLFRRKQIPTVTAGTQIGVRVPEIEPIDGRDVFGNKIVAAKPKTNPPILGDGVSEINNHLVAMRDGRVHFSRQKIDVLPTLVIKENLEPKDGHVFFDGDVLIQGDVLDYSKIRATGTVMVQGSAYSSVISGEHGVSVLGNVMNCTILGGQEAVMCKKLEPLVKQCIEFLERFRNDYRVVSDEVFKRFGDHSKRPMAIRGLLDVHYGRMVQLLGEIAETSDEDFLDKLIGNFTALQGLIRRKWQGVYLANVTEEDMEKLLWSLMEFQAYIENIRSEDVADVRVGSLTSSQVRTTGNILVTGNGCYAATLQSEKSVVVRGDIRGGFVVAGKRISANGVGTLVGTETSLKVLSENGKISAKEVHANTVIQVGDHRRRTLFTETNMNMKGESE